MLHYILQIVVFQLAFLLVYEMLLKKETFFTANRVYLLVTPVVAILLPLLKVDFLQQAIPAENLVMLPEVFLGENLTAVGASDSTRLNSEVATSINWWLLTYAGGLLFSLGIFFNKFKVLRELFSHRVIKRTEVRIIEIPNSRLACTFFHTIFLGANLSEKEREQILSHELVHVRQKHTVDLLFFEILKIIFWFNPLIYIYQKRISVLHEFLADAGVVKNVKKQDYFSQLLNSAFNTEDISFFNQFFNHSIIKKRIVMLQKTKSRSVSKIKFLIVLPLMLAMMTYVSCSSHRGQSKDKVQNPEPSSVEAKQKKDLGSNDLPIPFAVVEKVPVFPGCENLKNNQEQKECMSNGINEFVNKHFNTALGKELGLKGINRIYVQFKVSSDGKVTSVKSRAPHPALGEEAERVVSSLPDMEPAIQRGKEVAILYSLPISFQIPEPAPSEVEDEGDQN